MESGFAIRKNQYYDSVFLMGINNKISEVDGVINSAVLMGTENNKLLLSEIGIADMQIEEATPNDLIIAVIADDAGVVKSILADLDRWLEVESKQTSEIPLKSIEDGLAAKPNANLAVISVPGEYAYREAKKSLKNGLNVFLFSDNVPISEELSLKQTANEKGLLVMGPDCGTSIINGVGIGFANKVRRGNIGVIGASGTGLQEFTTQIHNAGLGISHAIGTGSRDLSDEVGGITTLAGLFALEKDIQTDVIAIVSKPPGQQTLRKIIDVAASFSKPVVGCFLGAEKDIDQASNGIKFAREIDTAVFHTIAEIRGQDSPDAFELSKREAELLTTEKGKLKPTQKYIRGVFAGGTFCYQAQQIFKNGGFNVLSNTPIDKSLKLDNPDSSIDHTMVDMGDDRYTVTKPHPMIDGTYRRKRILDESKDSSVGVILFDIILGYNASPDPVGDIIEAIIEAKQVAQKRGDYICFAASICGTDEDFQDKELLVEMLEQAGVLVFESNAKASLFCAKLLA
jgi:succinyl-CoA synthetase alpha subunit